MLTSVTPDVLVPQRHPIRRIKPMVDQALAQLSSTVTACILYGIRYADQLEGRISARFVQLVQQAGLPANYASEMHRGVNLARYVPLIDDAPGTE